MMYAASTRQSAMIVELFVAGLFLLVVWLWWRALQTGASREKIDRIRRNAWAIVALLFLGFVRILLLH